MNTIFGIIFSNGAGESAELAIEAGTNKLYLRTTNGGQWSTWVRVDAQRKATGELDETVWESQEAKRADIANKLATPVSITFTGGAKGSVSFDGSQASLTCDLNVDDAINAALNAQSGDTNVQKMISDAISSHVREWHVQPD